MPDTISSPPTILLVEDDPDILNLLHMLVRRWAAGYEILAVSSSEAALEAFEVRPALLVITDYNMPGMNGLQLTSAIKSRAPATRVVLITAYPSSALQQRALERGVDFYLPKPIQFDELEQIVRAALPAGERVS